MCNPPTKPLPSNSIDLLLELSASDELYSIKQIFADTEFLDSFGAWYGRSVGHTKRMALHDRTPLMVAALYGSVNVIEYLISNPGVDVNRRSRSDGATALHLAESGGAAASPDAVRMLLDASADVDSADASGQRPSDIIPKRYQLKASPSPRASSPETPTKPEAKKEYPPDLTLPDIKNGIYGTDEFRMYTFKVKPCSRAYSHDWTECPFVHPGENARRRDLRKYVYSCVPCPEFRKGSCRNGDGCEYAHGVFECWLHPAQYRTRLCKDEVGCNRRVCFFAHKPEELRSVNPTAASVTGLVMPSPRSLDMAAAMLLLSSSSSSSSPPAWMNQVPNLQLQSSRMKSSLNRFDLELELMGLEGYQQKLLDEMTTAASPCSNWPTSSSSLAASRASDYSTLLAGYRSNLPSSPTMNSSSSSFGLDHSLAKAIMNSRSAAFANRSQSFRQPSSTFPVSAGVGATDWGARDGKLDWGIHGEELSKFRKSASFAYRANRGSVSPPKLAPVLADDEPDLSWVHSLVKDGPVAANPDMISGWGEQMVA